MAYQSEAVISITTRMKDEASAKAEGLTKKLEAQKAVSMDLRMSLTAVGSALTGIGSLMGQLDSPAAKMASKFLLTAGALMTTTSAIITMVPVIRSLITWLRSLAIIQSVVQALSGPAGWATLGVGLGIAAGATAGVYALTRTNAGSAGGAPAVNINAQAFAGNRSEARKFGRELQTIARQDTRLGR